MQSNFTHTLGEMKRIDDNSSNDMQDARVAADQLEALAALQFGAINDFTELREVVTCGDEDRIRSSLAVIRHLHSALKELTEFHHDGLLESSFEVPFNNVAELLRKAEQQVPALLRHLQR
jgi:hypothetical protein